MGDIPIPRRSSRIANLGADSISTAPGVQRAVRKGVSAKPTPVTMSKDTNPIGEAQNFNVSEVANILSAFQIDSNKRKNRHEAETIAIPMPSFGNGLGQDPNNNIGLQQQQTTRAMNGDVKRSNPPASDMNFGMGNSVLLKNFDADNCQFCFVDLESQDGIMLQKCLHVFCKECLQAAIENNDAAIIACPVSDERQCNGIISDAEIKELVRPDVYREYIDRSLIIAKKKMKNVFSCQTEGCSSWVEFEVGRKTFHCPSCNKINCMECKAIHTGVDCETYKMLSQKGQLSKVEEIMEKESKSGWEQLISHVKASGDSGLEVNDFLAKTDIIKNTMEFECIICLTNIAKGQGVILHECLHMICRECLINYVEHNDEVTVKCPYIDGNYSCVQYMQPREIKALVPKATYEKHLQRSMKLGESSIENSFHCKTPDCPGWCEYDEGVKRFTCPMCKKNNCIACKAIHNGSCEDYKNRLQQNANDKLSEEAVEKLIKKGDYMRCPKCKIPVQKTVGCDWLQCSSCRTEICWATRGPRYVCDTTFACVLISTRWGPKGRGDTSGGCRCRVNGKLCHPKCGNCH